MGGNSKVWLFRSNLLSSTTLLFLVKMFVMLHKGCSSFESGVEDVCRFVIIRLNVIIYMLYVPRRFSSWISCYKHTVTWVDLFFASTIKT